MDFQFANLSIEKSIIHQIFQKNEKNEVVGPKYNDELIILDDQGQKVLEKRTIGAIGHDSYSIEMQVLNSNADSVFQLSSQLISCKDDEFIELSKNLALRLAQSQSTRRIPGGVFLVFRGTIGENREKCIGLIKAELHEGFKMTDIEQKMQFEYLSNLLLTPQQKLYKIGMFIEKVESLSTGLRDTNDFKVFVYDHNISRSETGEAAIYFYQTFLGCSIHLSSKKLTKDFFNLTKDFIDNQEIHDEEKINYTSALHTYLNVEKSNTIQVKEFAERYFDDNKLVDNYINYMQENNIPDNYIAKDLSGLERKLKRRKLNFSSSVTIVAPSENFAKLVKVVSSKDNITLIEINGYIKTQE